MTIDNSISQSTAGVSWLSPTGLIQGIFPSGPGQVLQTNSSGTTFIFESNPAAVRSGGVLNEQYIRWNSAIGSFPIASNGAQTLYSSAALLSTVTYTTQQTNSILRLVLSTSVLYQLSSSQQGSYCCVYLDPVVGLTAPICCAQSECDIANGGTLFTGQSSATLVNNYAAGTVLTFALCGFARTNASPPRNPQVSDYLHVLEVSTIPVSPLAFYVPNPTFPTLLFSFPVEIYTTLNVTGVWTAFDITTYTTVNGGSFVFAAMYNGVDTALGGNTVLQTTIAPSTDPYVTFVPRVGGGFVDIYANGLSTSQYEFVFNFTTN